MASTVRASRDELRSFVNYHLNTGVDQLLLFFDDPADESIASIGLNPRVTLYVCNEAYWQQRGVQRPVTIEDRQEINVNYALSMSRTRDVDWLIHIDSDELLLSREAIKDVLSTYPQDVVRFGMKRGSGR